MISMTSSAGSKGVVVAKKLALPSTTTTTAVLQFQQLFNQRSSSLSPSWRRSKSSIPSSSTAYTNDANEVYERASHNAATFDHQYRHILSSSSTVGGGGSDGGWRQRQMAITKLKPILPHATSPTQLIPPSNNSYPSSFFPPYAHTGIVPYSIHHDTILIHDTSSISRMKNAATLARQLLDYITHPSIISHSGITTDQLNSLLHYATLRHPTNFAYPSPLNYAGFPKSVCTSINEVVCHGIPDSRKLQVGDILSCDVSVFLEGVHGDNCGSVVVGDVEEGVLDEMIGGVGGERLSWDWYADWLSKYASSSSSSSADASGNNPPMENDTSSSSSAPSASEDASMPIKRDWPTYSLPQKTNFASHEEEERIITARRLVQAALESRDAGVAACKPGGCLSDVGAAIHAVADAYG